MSRHDSNDAAVYERQHDAETSITRCRGCQCISPGETFDITRGEAFALDVSARGILCGRCHKIAGNLPARARLDALVTEIGQGCGGDAAWLLDTRAAPAIVAVLRCGDLVAQVRGEDLGEMAEAVARDIAQAIIDNQPPPAITGRLTIMVGPPGSGKSTIAHSWRGDGEYGPPHILSADDFFMDPETREYRFDIARIGEAHASCLRAAVEAFQRGVGFVVIDNTGGSIAEMAPYVALGMAYGYEIEVVRVRCIVEVAAARNVHGVPPSIVRQIAEGIDAMFAAGLPPFWPVTVREAQT
jgi:predicted kinase